MNESKPQDRPHPITIEELSPGLIEFRPPEPPPERGEIPGLLADALAGWLARRGTGVRVRAALPFEDRGTTVRLWIWFDRNDGPGRLWSHESAAIGGVTTLVYDCDGALTRVEAPLHRSDG